MVDTGINTGSEFTETSFSGMILAPVAICKNITVELGTSGTATISASSVDGGSYDPDGTLTNLTVTPNTFDCSQVGINIVTLTVTDDEGLSASCSATVMVKDNTPPVVITRNFSLSLDAAGTGTITVGDIDNGSNDNCPAGLSFYLSRTKFTCSDIGVPVNVSLVATDASGNTTSSVSQITVTDHVDPVAILKPFTLVLDAEGNGTITPSDVDNGSYDNCGPVTLSVSPSSFTCSDLGEQDITLKVNDSHGNSSTLTGIVTVTSTLEIKGMSLSSCDLAPTLALFKAEVDGGIDTVMYFWQSMDGVSMPFIIPYPPPLQFYGTTSLKSPYFNNNMADGLYDIGLIVTDGKGCTDTSVITINSTGPIFDNNTYRVSESCEGEIKIYSVNYDPDAVYSWSVTNGTILNTDQDTSRIEVRWDMGVTDGQVTSTMTKPNNTFSGGQCESTVIDDVTISLFPAPEFTDTDPNGCSGLEKTYTLTDTYTNQYWTVTGGIITGGGSITDNYVTVRWNDVPSGTVSVSVSEGPSCYADASLNVNLHNLQGTIVSQTGITCNGGSDGTITLAAVDGTGFPPYQYSIDGGAWQSAEIFTGISLGNHSASIMDDYMCTFEIPFVIDQPSPVLGTISSLSDVSCFGGSDGSVTLAASGGTPSYQFSLNGGAYQASNSFSSLSAGSYTVTIIDSHNCTEAVIFTITAPQAPVSASVSVADVSCFGGTDGAADLTVSGGTAPYTYLWNNSAITEDLSDIPAGSYSVLVTDANGCTATANATVTEPASGVSGSTLVTNAACFGESTGDIDLTVTGGSSPYSFMWNNGATTEDLTDVAAGTYTVTITDSKNCTAISTGVVSEPTAAIGGSITSQNNVSCLGGNDGDVTVSGTGGSTPYEYSMNAGPFQSSGTFGTLTAGTYNVTVRDAGQCTYTLTVIITEPSVALTGTIISETNLLCKGEDTGSLSAAGSGGIAPYEYSIDGANYQASGTFNNLTAGSYLVRVRDFNLCTITLPVTINEPANPVGGSILSQTDVTCFSASTGAVTVAGSGGTMTFTYSIDAGAFQSSGTFNNLTAGAHNVIVRDFNLCEYTIAVNIATPTALIATVSKTDVLCQGGATGTATAGAAGGTAPYAYSWNTTPVQTTAAITSLVSGTYTVTVTDSKGCTTQADVEITEPSVTMTASVTTVNVSCFGSLTGSVDLTVTNGVLPLAYNWSDGATTEDITDVAAGTYIVTVTDANGCEAVASADVSQPSAALAGSITSQTDVTVYGESDGSVTVEGSDGTAPFQYKLDEGDYQASGTFGSLAAGDYIVTVQDAAMCTFEVPVTISQPWIPLEAKLSQTNVLCNGGNSGSLTVLGWGGTSPYEYSLNGGAYQSSGTFVDLTAGTYKVTVKDAIPDLYEIDIVITEPEVLGVSISKTDLHCFGASDGTAAAEVTGGTGPYAYSWDTSPIQTTATLTGLTAGIYSVTVTDANGCNVNESVELTQPATGTTITFTHVDVLCPGGSTGSATASATGGSEPYIYQWATSPYQNTSTANNLAMGNYTVTVTDNDGCQASGSVQIDEADAITVTSTSVNASCPDQGDGSISLSVSGGTPPYSFLWANGFLTQSRTNLRSGSYTVIVTDANLCQTSLDVEVGFDITFNCLEIPQVITPNNDGYNDEWIIKNIGNYPDAEVLIYNRWGKLVFKTKNLAANPWDGRSGGKLVPTDSYHYILYLNDGSEPRSGVISVIR